MNMHTTIDTAQAGALASTSDAALVRLWGEWIAQWERIELLRAEAFNLAIPIKDYVEQHEGPWADGEWEEYQRKVHAWMEANRANGTHDAMDRWNIAHAELFRLRRAMLRVTPEGPLGVGLQLATALLPPGHVDGGEEHMIPYEQRPGFYGALRGLSKLSGVDLIAQLPKTIAPV